MRELHTATFENGPDITLFAPRSIDKGVFDKMFPQFKGSIKNPNMIQLIPDTMRSDIAQTMSMERDATEGDSQDPEKARRAIALFKDVGKLLEEKGIPFVIDEGTYPALTATVNARRTPGFSLTKRQDLVEAALQLEMALKAVEAKYDASPLPPYTPEPPSSAKWAERSQPLPEIIQPPVQVQIKQAVFDATEGYQIAKGGLTPEQATASLVDAVTEKVLEALKERRRKRGDQHEL